MATQDFPDIIYIYIYTLPWAASHVATCKSPGKLEVETILLLNMHHTPLHAMQMIHHSASGRWETTFSFGVD